MGNTHLESNAIRPLSNWCVADGTLLLWSAFQLQPSTLFRIASTATSERGMRNVDDVLDLTSTGKRVDAARNVHDTHRYKRTASQLDEAPSLDGVHVGLDVPAHARVDRIITLGSTQVRRDMDQSEHPFGIERYWSAFDSVRRGRYPTSVDPSRRPVDFVVGQLRCRRSVPLASRFRWVPQAVRGR